MRAVVAYDWGDIDTLRLESIPDPKPGIGEVLIRVRACGVNFADTLMVAGRYQFRPPLPFSPGMEMAGEVLEVGQAVYHIKPGDRVAGMAYYGGFAEQVTLPAETLLPLPDTMDFKTAAAFPATYSTSHIALMHRARLRPGERLLVLGAAGGIGLAAVEIGALFHATVIAGASSDGKLVHAQQHGAHYLINYREESLRGRLREITNGEGVDVVFDPVGGELFKQAYRSVAWEGRYLVVGFASGQIPETSVNRLLIYNFALVGVEWGTYMRRRSPLINKSLSQLLLWHSEHEIHPHVSASYSLENTVEALRAVLNRETTGRVVITP